MDTVNGRSPGHERLKYNKSFIRVLSVTFQRNSSNATQIITFCGSICEFELESQLEFRRTQSPREPILHHFHEDWEIRGNSRLGTKNTFGPKLCFDPLTKPKLIPHCRCCQFLASARRMAESGVYSKIIGPPISESVL